MDSTGADGGQGRENGDSEYVMGKEGAERKTSVNCVSGYSGDKNWSRREASAYSPAEYPARRLTSGNHIAMPFRYLRLHLLADYNPPSLNVLYAPRNAMHLHSD